MVKHCLQHGVDREVGTVIGVSELVGATSRAAVVTDDRTR